MNEGREKMTEKKISNKRRRRLNFGSPSRHPSLSLRTRVSVGRVLERVRLGSSSTAVAYDKVTYEEYESVKVR